MPIIVLTENTVQTPVVDPGGLSTDINLKLQYSGTGNTDISIAITGENSSLFTAELYRLTYTREGRNQSLVATTGDGGTPNGTLFPTQDHGVTGEYFFEIIFNAPTTRPPDHYSATLTVTWTGVGGGTDSALLIGNIGQITVTCENIAEPSPNSSGFFEIQINYVSFDDSILDVEIGPAEPVPTGLIVNTVQASLPPTYTEPPGDPGSGIAQGPHPTKTLNPSRTTTVDMPITCSSPFQQALSGGTIPVQVTPLGQPQLNPPLINCPYQVSL